MAGNLYREHLNWHLTDDAYRQDKLRLLALPGVERCVVNALSPGKIVAPRDAKPGAAGRVEPDPIPHQIAGKTPVRRIFSEHPADMSVP